MPLKLPFCKIGFPRQNLICRTNICLVFADRNHQRFSEISILFILNAPTTSFELFVNAIAGNLFGSLIHGQSKIIIKSNYPFYNKMLPLKA